MLVVDQVDQAEDEEMEQKQLVVRNSRHRYRPVKKAPYSPYGKTAGDWGARSNIVAPETWKEQNEYILATLRALRIGGTSSHSEASSTSPTIVITPVSETLHPCPSDVPPKGFSSLSRNIPDLRLVRILRHIDEDRFARITTLLHRLFEDIDALKKAVFGQIGSERMQSLSLDSVLDLYGLVAGMEQAVYRQVAKISPVTLPPLVMIPPKQHRIASSYLKMLLFMLPLFVRRMLDMFRPDKINWSTVDWDAIEDPTDLEHVLALVRRFRAVLFSDSDSNPDSHVSGSLEGLALAPPFASSLAERSSLSLVPMADAV